MRRRVRIGLVFVVGAVALAAAQSAFAAGPNLLGKGTAGLQCTTPGLSYLCVDVGTGPAGWPDAPFWNYRTPATYHQNVYVGHDEPSLLFYSDKAGSGNDNTWQITLPTDPKGMPRQGQASPVWGFQEHVAFWFGMAMCDSQSFPQYTSTCNPDTNANIFDDSSSTSPGFIGHHPGTAFMEMQFYPPGWIPEPAGNACGATSWCAALNIDSLSENGATGEFGGPCNAIGFPEYINYAYITKSGVPTASPSPLDLGNQFALTPDILYMKSGDRLVVSEHDTFSGLEIEIHDLTSGQSGHMVASAGNGFQQIDPATCAGTNYNFHPMYSTSSVHTRVPWAAHSYNVAYSDELGHFDYCNGAPESSILFSPCPRGYSSGGFDGATERLDDDETVCVDGSYSALVPVTGCFDSNVGFDGASYASSSWPGNGHDGTPTPVEFNSPYINGQPSSTFSQIGFETDLPRIEVEGPGNPFLRCDRTTGTGCTNPPLTDDGVPSQFYPIYTTGQTSGQCNWREGGPNLPSTINNFGGTSTSEYGSLLSLVYQAGATTTLSRFNDYRQIITNPC